MSPLNLESEAENQMKSHIKTFPLLFVSSHNFPPNEYVISLTFAKHHGIKDRWKCK